MFCIHVIESFWGEWGVLGAFFEEKCVFVIVPCISKLDSNSRFGI